MLDSFCIHKFSRNCQCMSWRVPDSLSYLMMGSLRYLMMNILLGAGYNAVSKITASSIEASCFKQEACQPQCSWWV